MRARHWMQIAAVASAVGLTGTAIANDMDRTPTSSDDTSTTVTGNPAQVDNDATPSRSALPDNAVTLLDYGTTQPNDNGSTINDNSGTSSLDGNPPTIDNGAAGTTQGSTMVSPKSDTTAAPAGGARYGTPGETTAPPRTGSDAQAGDMGPGSTRGN